MLKIVAVINELIIIIEMLQDNYHHYQCFFIDPCQIAARFTVVSCGTMSVAGEALVQVHHGSGVDGRVVCRGSVTGTRDGR